MPRRNEFIRTNQTFYVKQPNGQCYTVYSPEQMSDLIEKQIVTDDDKVFVKSSPNGFGGDRGIMPDPKKKKVTTIVRND